MLYGVDRFEGEFAVLIDGQGAAVNVRRQLLPDDVAEGDVLSFDGEKYSLNKEATAARRQEAKGLIDELFQ